MPERYSVTFKRHIVSGLKFQTKFYCIISKRIAQYIVVGRSEANFAKTPFGQLPHIVVYFCSTGLCTLRVTFVYPKEGYN